MGQAQSQVSMLREEFVTWAEMGLLELAQKQRRSKLLLFSQEGTVFNVIMDPFSTLDSDFRLGPNPPLSSFCSLDPFPRDLFQLPHLCVDPPAMTERQMTKEAGFDPLPPPPPPVSPAAPPEPQDTGYLAAIPPNPEPPDINPSATSIGALLKESRWVCLFDAATLTKEEDRGPQILCYLDTTLNLLGLGIAQTDNSVWNQEKKTLDSLTQGQISVGPVKDRFGYALLLHFPMRWFSPLRAPPVSSSSSLPASPVENQLFGFALIPLSQVLLRHGKLEKQFSLSLTDLFHSPAGNQLEGKLQIAMQRLIPRVFDQHGLKSEFIQFSVVFAMACEMFILELTFRPWNHTEGNKRGVLQKNEIAGAALSSSGGVIHYYFVKDRGFKEKDAMLGNSLHSSCERHTEGLPKLFARAFKCGSNVITRGIIAQYPLKWGVQEFGQQFDLHEYYEVVIDCGSEVEEIHFGPALRISLGWKVKGSHFHQTCDHYLLLNDSDFVLRGKDSVENDYRILREVLIVLSYCLHTIFTKCCACFKSTEEALKTLIGWKMIQVWTMLAGQCKNSGPNGKKLHEFVVRSCVDRSIWLATTLVKKYMKYGHVSWTLEVFVQVVANSDCLAFWNVMVLASQLKKVVGNYSTKAELPEGLEVELGEIEEPEELLACNLSFKLSLGDKAVVPGGSNDRTPGPREEEVIRRDKTAVLLWMHDPAGRDATIIRQALIVDRNLEAATEVICSRTPSQLQYLKQLYHSKFGVYLEHEIELNTSGDHQKILLAYISTPRHEGPEVNREIAQKDAKVLYKAGEKKLGTDEKTFVHIFSERSGAHLAAVGSYYHDMYGHSLKKAVKNEASGNFRHALLTIIQCATNPGKYFAKVLHKAMKGLGTNDTTLIRVIVTRTEIDMQYIKAEYLKKYRKTLNDAVHSETSSHYRAFLLALLGPNH